MTVRHALENDYERLRQFDEFNEATLERIRNRECLIAEYEGTVSAYAVINRAFFGRPFVAFVCVAPERRRAGLCNALLAHMELQCPDPKLWISTALRNSAMQRVLEKRGYCLSGVVHDLGEMPELIFYKRIGS